MLSNFDLVDGGSRLYIYFHLVKWALITSTTMISKQANPNPVTPPIAK